MTYYDTLGIDPSVEQGAVRKAYLKLSLKHHPDKNPNNVEEAKAKFIEIGTGEYFVGIKSIPLPSPSHLCMTRKTAHSPALNIYSL
jgi:hypothetical protein